MWKLKEKLNIIKRKFEIYFRAFVKNINCGKAFSSENITTWNLENSSWGITGTMAGYPDMIELFPEIVVTYEVKSDEDVKVFTLKAIVKMYIEVCSFTKPRNNVWSLKYLKLLRRNHCRNIWRLEFVEKVMHIIQISDVLQVEVIQAFFYLNTYTDNLVAEFPVLEHF